MNIFQWSKKAFILWTLLVLVVFRISSHTISNVNETIGLLEPSPAQTVPTSDLQAEKQTVETIDMQGTSLGYEMETSLHTDQSQQSLNGDSGSIYIIEAFRTSQVITPTLSSYQPAGVQSNVPIQLDQSKPVFEKIRDPGLPEQSVQDSIKIITSPAKEDRRSEVTGEPRSEATVDQRSDTTVEQRSEVAGEPRSDASGESKSEITVDQRSDTTSDQSSDSTVSQRSEVKDDLRSDTSGDQRSEGTGANGLHIKEVQSEVKDTFPGVKEPIPGVKNTLPGVKDTITVVKDTVSEVKDTVSGVKDTLLEVTEPGLKVKAENGQSGDLPQLLNEVPSGEPENVKNHGVQDGDFINSINTKDINSGLEFPHGETMPVQELRDIGQEIPKGTEFNPEIQRNVASELPKGGETVFEMPHGDKIGVELGGELGVRAKVEENKDEEEGLTFNEWTQKVLAEAEKGKQEEVLAVDDKPILPVKPRKKKNYAAYDCGAKILASNPEASNVKSVLNANKDDYLNTPCKVKKWFVVELCEPIQAHSIEIASLELFSSQPKKVKVMLSDRYPTKDWQLAGEFEMKDERTEQTFQIDKLQEYYAKYVRFDVLEHYGNEHFCPITKFRVLGVAVADYEDDDNHDNEGDGVDNDHDDLDVVEAGHDGKAKNLFESAKDTVVRIVKKVLNVEDISENTSHNSTEDAVVPSGVEMEHNVTVTPSGEAPTSPCVPCATIPGIVPTTTPDPNIGIQLPLPPEPGQTNIVRMLDEDEQVETSSETPEVKYNIPTTPLDMFPGKSLIKHFLECLQIHALLSGTKRNSSLYHSRLCQFAFLVLMSNPDVNWVKNRCSVHMKSKESRQDSKQNFLSSSSMQHMSSEKRSSVSSTIKFDAVSATMEVSTTSVNLENTVLLMDKVSGGTLSVTESLDSSQNMPVKLEAVTMSDEIKPTSVSYFSKETESVLQFQQSVVVESKTWTTVLSSSTKLALSTASLSSESVATATLSSESAIRSSSSSSSSSTTEAVQIDPSPTVVNSKEHTTGSQSTIATPPLSQSWAPDTVDINSETSVAGDHGKPESSAASSSTVINNLPQPILGTIDASSTATVQASILETIATSEVPSSADVTMDMGNLDDLTDDLGAVEEGYVKPNATVIDDKVVMDRGGLSNNKGDTLNLVRVPIIPPGKRESAIMRLSNRIKVLEQNVSLSSRFLEELSRRYKKQSEDMMKMLNKTMARLANGTVEADVRNKLHEDEMYIMEKKVENLTAIINRLTHNFEQLNKQVTDRQMIWTSIEILVILATVLFLHFRRQKPVPLPPEVKSLIDKMPTMPAGNKPIQRRNSISGPATPSKKLADTLHIEGGGLQRFCSETALASVAGRDHHRHSADSSKQCFEFGKKKKKKKSKGAELKSYMRDGPGPSLQDIVSIPAVIPEPAVVVLPTSCEVTSYELIEPVKPRSNSLEIIGKENVKNITEGAKDRDFKGTKVGNKNPSKKSPQSGGTKNGHFSMKNSRIVSDFETVSFAKSHRRQKSLPKQYYFSTVETIGQLEEMKTGMQEDTNIHTDFAVSKPKKSHEKRLKAFTSNDDYLCCYPERNSHDQLINGHHNIRGSNSNNGFDTQTKAANGHLVKSYSADTNCIQNDGILATQNEYCLKQRKATAKNDSSEPVTITNGDPANITMFDSHVTKSDVVNASNGCHLYADTQPCSLENLSDVYRPPREVWSKGEVKSGSQAPWRKIFSLFKTDD